MLYYFSAREWNFLLPSSFTAAEPTTIPQAASRGPCSCLEIPGCGIIPGTNWVFSKVHCLAKFAFPFLDTHLQMEWIHETSWENKFMSTPVFIFWVPTKMCSHLLPSIFILQFYFLIRYFKPSVNSLAYLEISTTSGRISRAFHFGCLISIMSIHLTSFYSSKIMFGSKLFFQHHHISNCLNSIISIQKFY